MNAHRFRAVVVIASGWLLAGKVPAQAPNLGGSLPTSPSSGTFSNTYLAPDVEVVVKGADGARVPKQAVVQLVNLNGQIYDELPVRNGQARFSRVPRNEFRVLVKAPGFERAEGRVNLISSNKVATVTVEVRPISDAEEAAADRELSALSPKTQKEVGKALEALQAKKPNDARLHLEAAQKQVPNNAEVEYLFGVYATQLNDTAQSQAHWKKTITLNPNHLSALIELGQGLVLENKAVEAMPYLKRAIEVEPSSWRVHALLAEADYLQQNREDATKEAERALELGHSKATTIQPLLARCLAENGQKEKAIEILQDHLKTNPGDTEAAKQLEYWKNPGAASEMVAGDAAVGRELAAVNSAVTALPVPSNWMPSDVDEKMPPVDTTAGCSLDEIVPKAGERLVTLVHDVDRFTATELLFDESINKWGMPGQPERRTFDYVVAMEEVRPGYLSVDEYRNSGGKPAEFPDGVITNGLPALVMVFHPFYAANYEMTCEGLAKWNGAPVWQVHFRQRPDKQVSNRGYRMGRNGPSYPVALKGRAWISADNYQIVRLETDLLKPVPAIRLAAEHTAIEYSSVIFREGNVRLWLPQTAEVFFEWNGRRVHRRHTFNNYMLFAVDEKERIANPKGAEAPAANVSEAPNSQQP